MGQVLGADGQSHVDLESKKLTLVPPQRLALEWATIGPALARALEIDPERDAWCILEQGLRGELQFWRAGRVLGGLIVTQVTRHPGTLKRLFCVIYVAVRGGLRPDMRALVNSLEPEAVRHRCAELRFEGHDWRKIFPDYQAIRGHDGHWCFRKILMGAGHAPARTRARRAIAAS